MSAAIQASAASNSMARLAGLRQHFDRKMEYIRQTGKANSRQTNPNGWNPCCLLHYARRRNPTKPKTPVELYLQLQHYTFQDFQSWNLPSAYARWNSDLGSLELAKRRYIPKGEKRTKEDREKGDAWLYPPEDQLEWVAVAPGSTLVFSDFQGSVTQEYEDSIVKLMDACPKYKSPEQRAKYPNDPDYQWYVGSFHLNVGRFKPAAVPKIMFDMPSAVFRLVNPKRAAVLPHVVLLKLHDWFGTAVAEEMVGDKPFSIAKLIYAPEDASWAYESKTSLPGTPYVETAVAGGGTKKLTAKCMKLFGGVEQSEGRGGKLSTIEIHVVAWDGAVEDTYKVRDIKLWFNVMRFVVPVMAPAVWVTGVSKARTEQNLLNINQDGGDEGEEGEEVTISTDPSESASPWPSVPGTPATPATPAATAAEAVGDKDAIDDDFASLIHQQTQQLAAQEAGGRVEKIDFHYELTLLKADMDTYEVFRRFLIPVVPAWCLPRSPAPGQPKAFNNFLASPGGNVPNLNVSRLQDVPDVVCASEYWAMPGVATKLCEYVAKGQGEFRVAVNTPTYTNNSISAAFVEAIRGLTPEEGTLLLDGKPIPGKTVTWTRPETAQYVLFFLNKSKRNPEALNEAVQHAQALMDKFIRANRIGSADESADQQIVPAQDDIAAAAAAAAASAAERQQLLPKAPASGSADVLDAIGTKLAQQQPQPDVVMAEPSPVKPSPKDKSRVQQQLEDEENRRADSGSEAGAEGADKSKKKKREEKSSSSKHHSSKHSKNT